MQATQSGSFGKYLGETTSEVRRRASTTATSRHRASQARALAHPIAADVTIPQRIARYGLTAIAIVAMSALFATQIAASLH